MARKRSTFSNNDHASKPNEVARRETISPANNALSSENARIAEPEHQIEDLHAFIDANGLTWSRCPYAVPPILA